MVKLGTVDVHVDLHAGAECRRWFDRFDSRLGQIMTALEDLQAASQAEADALAALKAEQATFLADIAAQLADSGIDPAALAPITEAITARVADLQALTAAEVAADPAESPVDAPTEPVADAAPDA